MTIKNSKDIAFVVLFFVPLRGFYTKALSDFELYDVDLKALTPGKHEFEYLLEDKFFVDVDGGDVQRGKVRVSLTVKRTSMVFDMVFRIEGSVFVPCDRCLDDVEVPIDTRNHLVVKFGKEYTEEDAEIIVVSEEKGSINLAWFLYEFIALAVPMKHVHAQGKCNGAMMTKLKEHMAGKEDKGGDGCEESKEDVSLDGGASGGCDPRWNALRGLIGDDNN